MPKVISEVSEFEVDNTGTKYVHKEVDDAGNVSYLRADGLYDLPIEIDDEILLHVALEAHKMDITLNQFFIKAIEEYISLSESTSDS
jgi:hypothetical protein